MHAHFKIFTALSFLKLKSPDLLWFQWGYPIALCFIIQISFWALPIMPSLLGSGGVVESVNGLMTMLIGFYIASLAAIASFPSDTLNLPMKGRAPEVSIRRGKKNKKEVLTRRRFLCILFGYCAFISIFIYVIGVVSIMLLPSAFTFPLFIELLVIFKIAWMSIYFFFSSSLLLTTLLGLHYLIDRMHRN